MNKKQIEKRPLEDGEDIKRKSFFLVLIGIILLAVIGTYLKRKTEDQLNWIKPSLTESLTIYLNGEGQIKPGNEWFLTVNKGGKLDKLLEKADTSVKKGQLLGIVDETNRKAGLQSALSSYRLAAADFSRISSLVKTGAATPQEVDDTRKRLDVERSNLEQAKNLMEDGLLRSPADGYLSLLAFSVGDIIPDGSRVGVVEDTSFYNIVIKIPVEYKNKIPKNVSIEIQKLDMSSGKTENPQTIEATLNLPNPESNFDGMSVDVAIFFKTLPNGFSVRNAVMVKIPVVTYKNVALMERGQFYWKDNAPYLIIKDPHDDGLLALFSPEIGLPNNEKTTVLNLNKDMELLAIGTIKNLDSLLAKKLKTSTATR